MWINNRWENFCKVLIYVSLQISKVRTKQKFTSIVVLYWLPIVVFFLWNYCTHDEWPKFNFSKYTQYQKSNKESVGVLVKLRDFWIVWIADLRSKISVNLLWGKVVWRHPRVSDWSVIRKRSSQPKIYDKHLNLFPTNPDLDVVWI